MIYWKIHDEILWFDDKLYLLEQLRNSILISNHDNLLTDYFKIKKILKLMQRKYYWFNENNNSNAFLNIRKLIKNYCETCAVCKCSKTLKHKSFEKLQTLLTLEFKWSNLMLNFVTSLSINRNWNEVEYDSILIMIDRLTKMIHYISIIKIISVEDLTKIFIKEVVRLHDLFLFIIIDKKSLFTSSFWSTFCYIMKIKRKFLSRFMLKRTNKLNVKITSWNNISEFMWTFNKTIKWNYFLWLNSHITMQSTFLWKCHFLKSCLNTRRKWREKISWIIELSQNLLSNMLKNWIN